DRDFRDGLYAAGPRLAYAGEVACRVLGAHKLPPELFRRRVGHQPDPGRPRRRGRVRLAERQLSQRGGGRHDLRGDGVYQLDVQPPVIAASKRLASDHGERRCDLAGIPRPDALVGEPGELVPVDPGLLVQRVPAMAKMLDPLAPATGPAELAPCSGDELPE